MTPHPGPFQRSLQLGACSALALVLATGAVSVDGYGVHFDVPSAHARCCFVAGTLVRLAHGALRPIEQIRPGDRVLGRDGRGNRVTRVERRRLCARRLFAFNGGRPFVTSEHPFLTAQGWKSISPVMTAAENPQLRVAALRGGDRVAMCTVAPAAAVSTHGNLAVQAQAALQLDWLRLERIDAHEADPATLVYNLLLDGDHTYIADGFLVHNKGGGDGGGSGGGGSGGGDDGGGSGSSGGDSDSDSDSGGDSSGSDSSGSGGSGSGGDDADGSDDGAGGGSGRGGSDDDGDAGDDSDADGNDGRGRGRGRTESADDEPVEDGDDSSSRERTRTRTRTRTGDDDRLGAQSVRRERTESETETRVDQGERRTRERTRTRTRSADEGSPGATGTAATRLSGAAAATSRRGDGAALSRFGGAEGIAPAGPDLDRDEEAAAIRGGWRP